MPNQEPAPPDTSAGETAVRQALHAGSRLGDPASGEAGAAATTTATAVHEPLGAYSPVDHEEWLDEEPGELPRRPRRRLLAPIPLALMAALLIACGFIGGALLEKGQVSTGTGAAGRSGTHAGAPTAAGFAKAGSTRGGAAGDTTTGEVSYVRNGMIYVKDSEEATVKVTAAGATVKKTITTKVDKIHPGETVVVSGTQSSNGTIKASTITVGATGLTGGFGDAGSGSSSTGSAGGSTLFGP